MADWSLTLPNLVGYLGVTVLVGTYGALQFDRLKADDPWYSALNGLAALLIGFSLLFNFNAPSMVIEVFWFGISLYGFVKSIRARRSSHQAGVRSEE